MYFGKQDATTELVQYYSSFVKQILKSPNSDRGLFTEIPTFIIFRDCQWYSNILVFLYCRNFAKVDLVEPKNTFKCAPIP